MSKYIVNPFRFEGVVTDGDFCGREKDINKLLAFMHSGNNVIISMKRRVGKTSLVKEIYKNHISNGLIAGFADIYSITSVKEFYLNIKDEVEKILSLSRKFNIAIDRITDAFGNANVSIKAGAAVNIKIEFNGNNYGELIKKLLLSLQNYAHDNNLRITFAIDEFQKIEKLLEEDRSLIEASMRTAMQDCKNISFVILGSNQTALDSIFQENRPLYRQGSHYALKPICEDVFFRWVKNKFKFKEITISESVFSKIYELANSEAKIVQHICFELFNVVNELNDITLEDVDNAVIELYKDNSEISTKFNYLKLTEQKMMKVITFEKNKGVTVSPLLQEYGINHGSVNGLLKQMIKSYKVTKISTGKYEIVDTEMKLWIMVLDKSKSML